MGRRVLLIKALIFLTIFAVLVAYGQAQDQGDPLERVFRVVSLGMPRDSVLEIIKQASTRSVMMGQDDFLISLGWMGEDLLKTGGKPVSFLHIKLDSGTVFCAHYHFYYDGSSDEHRYKGVCSPK